MATISSHILDSVGGCSAAGIRVSLSYLDNQSQRRVLFDVFADEQGRITERVTLDNASLNTECELVFHSADYFSTQSITADKQSDDSLQMMKTVVIRFYLSDRDQRYHFPLMLSPHAYSVWWSN